MEIIRMLAILVKMPEAVYVFCVCVRHIPVIAALLPRIGVSPCVAVLGMFAVKVRMLHIPRQSALCIGVGVECRGIDVLTAHFLARLLGVVAVVCAVSKVYMV